MTIPFEARRALAQEIDTLALRLRAEDLSELRATAFDDDPASLMQPFNAPQALQQGFFVDGQPVAVWAAVEQHPGLFMLGFVASAQWQAIAKPASRYIKQQIKPRLFELGMRKGVALSHADHRIAHRWMAWLGMREEARFVGHGKNGEDFLLFSIFAESASEPAPKSVPAPAPKITPAPEPEPMVDRRA